MVEIPTPIQAYFSVKSGGSFDELAEFIADDAVVYDVGEDQEIRGLEQIKEWIMGTSDKYKLTSEIRDALTEGDETVLQVIVTGDFPGSPYEFAYTFTLSGDKISCLAIDPIGPLDQV